MASARVASCAAKGPATVPASEVDLRAHGLINLGSVHANLSPTALTELALARAEGFLTDKGALVAYTGKRTGRSPQDRYLVAEPSSQGEIWWGAVNRPMEPGRFNHLLDKVLAYFQGRDVFVFDGWACADPRHRFHIRVVAELAWHALFAHCLFLRPPREALARFQPQLTILCASGLRADPASDGTRSEAFIVLNLDRGLVLIGGTQYAGEMKKSVFSMLNYLLPRRGVFPMHCSANIGPAGDTALFFGLSGTGKTTLSADPERRLIGDDEHGWSGEGVFNVEGGCYAKTIRLSREGEPQIWNALRFGCVLENVAIDPHTRRPDFDDDQFTENTRAAYPVDFIDNCESSGQGGHPRSIIFLTCDAFGVLPPVSRLTPEQAMYHFLSGYTAKVAGTEVGVLEPRATFSPCFGGPFLVWHPAKYADLLADKMQRHRTNVWLVNTGWSGGSYGVGSRMKLSVTRSIIDAIHSGALAHAPVQRDPVFGFEVVTECPGVPAEVLLPRNTWANRSDYDATARNLAALFQDNFRKYESIARAEVKEAGPRPAS